MAVVFACGKSEKESIKIEMALSAHEGKLCAGSAISVCKLVGICINKRITAIINPVLNLRL